MILFFGVAIMSFPIFANVNESNQREFTSMSIVNDNYSMPDEYSDVLSIENFSETLLLSEEECTVTLTATVFGVAVSASVTAETCSAAGAGAIDALIAAAGRVKDLAKYM